METEKADFWFDGYIVTESTIKIDTNIVNPGKLNVQFDLSGIENVTCDNSYQLTLTTTIADNKSIYIRLSVVAQFRYSPNIKKDILDGMFSINAPVILFPYVRAYISAVTALSGIAPITIPTINFIKTAQMTNRT